MEIHQPEGPLRSLKDFLLHIVTVTIGILIALALDAIVHAHHDHLLADHARADFRQEFTHNRAAILHDKQDSTVLGTELAGLIAFGKARLAHQTAKPPQLSAARRFVFADSVAWQTAVATQSLLNLSFAETQAISAAYLKQTAFNEIQGKAEQEWFELAAFGDPATVPDDQVQAGLQKVTIAYAYVTSIANLEARLIDDYDKALALLKQ